MTLRIGSVPYLNAKPLIDWFHSPECDADVTLIYDVPSHLARMLREGELDVANCSIFECLQNPELVILPDISISACGPVKSVRLFSQVPMTRIGSVALDTSSLTSVALTRILLAEVFNISPCYEHHAPDLQKMLATCDAGLLIGDLNLFEELRGVTVYDLGRGWHDLTGLPFVYAAWQARPERVTPDMVRLLTRAKQWGTSRLDFLAEHWAQKMGLPLDRCRDYLLNVMDYDLTPQQIEGLRQFQAGCRAHNLIPAIHPLRFAARVE